MALDAFAAAVDQADLIDASPLALLQVLLYHAWNVLRREGMQIDRVIYGNGDRLAIGRICSRITARVFQPIFPVPNHVWMEASLTVSDSLPR